LNAVIKIWAFREGKPFVNLFNAPDLDIEDLFSLFDTSMEKIAAELRYLYNGKQGYYIANILNKEYYYCGTEWENVKNKLKELGIGRNDRF
jgi:YHS domain-containing protein